MKKQELKKLLRKSLLFHLMTKIDQLLHEAEIPHSKLSTSSGQKHSWFNDAFNNSEDISLSSFTKIISVINNKLDFSDYKLTDMFDKKALKIARLIANLTDEEDNNLSFFICFENDLFGELLGDWSLLKAKRKLSENEQKIVDEIRSILANNTREEQ